MYFKRNRIRTYSGHEKNSGMSSRTSPLISWAADVYALFISLSAQTTLKRSLEKGFGAYMNKRSGKSQSPPWVHICIKLWR